MTQATTEQQEQAAQQHAEETSLALADDTPTENLPAISSDASLMMDPRVFEHMQRVCKVYSASDVVPQQFRGNLPNCMIAYELAHRLQVNVFMLMQSMYVVSGKPGMEAKLAIALVNERGPFRGTIQYEIERDDKGGPVACTAYATLKSTGERCETTVTWDVVKKEGWDKKSGSKWQTMPEQMFKYRAAAWLARTYCPEVLMGMHLTDELEDSYGDTRYVDSTSAAPPAPGRHKLGAQPEAQQAEPTDDPRPTQEEAPQEPPAEPEADASAEAEVPTDEDADAASKIDQIIQVQAEVKGVQSDKAEAALEQHCKQHFKAALRELSDEQLAELEKQAKANQVIQPRKNA